MSSLKPLACCLAALAIAWPGAKTSAQSTAPEAVHWALGSYFGTGRYRIEGSEIYVLAVEPAWRLRESALDPGGGRRIGIRLRFPVTIGVYQFDPRDPGGAFSADNVSTLSAVPGVEFDLPLNERWSLKPFVHLGAGTELRGGESASIYWTGLRTRRVFHADRFDWSLINGLTYIGYDAGSNEGDVLALQSAFEFALGLKNTKLHEHPVDLHWHVAYTSYLNELRVGLLASTDRIDIGDEWELGAAFSLRDHRLGIRRLRFDRVGLAYRFSAGGDFDGVSLTFGSVFDR